MTKDNKDTDSLHSAILNNDIEKVKQLIEGGADLNSPNVEGLRPLHVALKKNNKKIVKLLINLDLKGNLEVDMTVWIYAIMLDDKRIIRLLLKHYLHTVEICRSQPFVHYCVKYRSLYMLNHIKYYVDINQVDINGYTALHLAIINNDVEMAKKLLELGANVYAKTVDGRSSIHFAVKHKCFETLLMLIDANVDVNDPVTSTGEHPLHIAVKNNDISTVNLLIRSGGNYLHCTDNKGKTLLHVAVENEYEEMLKFLLKKNLNVNARFGKKQKSVLDLALSTRNSQIITTILNYDPDLNSKNKDGLSAIFIALQYRCFKIANEIFSLKPDFDVITNHGSSLLHYALRYKEEHIANYLIENNINIDIIDDKGKNSLHYAAEHGSAKLVTLLADKNVDVNAKTVEGTTPLHLAVSNISDENIDIVEILLHRGAEVNAIDVLKKTPIFYIKHKKEEVFTLLLKQGANINHFDVDGQGLVCYIFTEMVHLLKKGNELSSLIDQNLNFSKVNENNDNIYHYLVKTLINLNSLIQFHRHLNSFTQFHEHLNGRVDINGVNNDNKTALNICLENYPIYDLMSYLISCGATANKNKEGECPLHLTIKAQQYLTTKYLLEKGADLKAITIHRSTVLHYAIQYGKNEKKDEDEDILKLLLEYDVDDIVNAQNDEGKTPLHLAALKNSLWMVETLFNKIIDINVKDVEDNSPLCYAIANKNLSMVKLLLKKGASTKDKHRGLSIYDLAKDSGHKHIYQMILLF